MSPAQDFYRELPRYIRMRTEQLFHCHCLIEKKIYDDKFALGEKQRKSGAADDPSFGRVWHHLEYTLGNTFRYTLLIGVCSVLEESVKTIAEQRFPDEAERTKTMKSQEGNWLQKHIHLFSTCAAFKPNEHFQTDSDQFTDIITLRNCIGHSWGNVDNDDHPAQIREAVQRIQTRAKQTNSYLAEISSDGFIFLGENTVSEALFLAVNIVDGICRAILDTTP